MFFYTHWSISKEICRRTSYSCYFTPTHELLVVHINWNPQYNAVREITVESVELDISRLNLPCGNEEAQVILSGVSSY